MLEQALVRADARRARGWDNTAPAPVRRHRPRRVPSPRRRACRDCRATRGRSARADRTSSSLGQRALAGAPRVGRRAVRGRRLGRVPGPFGRGRRQGLGLPCIAHVGRRPPDVASAERQASSAIAALLARRDCVSSAIMPLPAAAGRSARPPGPAYRMAGAGQTANGCRGSRVGRAAALGIALTAALALAGCDPVFDVEGAFFPSWMVCMLGGVIGAAALRPLLGRSGLEPHLGPLPLVYSCLALLISFAAWLTFFRPERRAPSRQRQRARCASPGACSARAIGRRAPWCSASSSTIPSIDIRAPTMHTCAPITSASHRTSAARSSSCRWSTTSSSTRATCSSSSTRGRTGRARRGDGAARAHQSGDQGL